MIIKYIVNCVIRDNLTSSEGVNSKEEGKGSDFPR